MKLRYYLIMCGLALTLGRASAQNNSLAANQPQSGQITDEQAQSWELNLRSGEIFTIEAAGRDGLDPQITIANSAGLTLFSNDDARYPGNLNALGEALTAPVTDTYQISISGFGGSVGGYEISYLPGYGDLVFHESFEDAGTWEPLTTGLRAEAAVADGQLTLSVEGMAATSIVPAPGTELPETYFARFMVSDVRAGAQNWSVGLVLHHQTEGPYYQMLLRQDGLWRLDRIEDDAVSVVRDWSPHPAVVPGAATFALSVLARPGMLEFFFDDQLIGSSILDEVLSGGRAGFVIATGSSNDTVTATVDELIITQPIQIGSSPVFPTQLVASESSSIVQELQRRGVIPSGGDQVLSIDEASSNYRGPGVSRLPLARGSEFSNFVMGTTIMPMVSGEDPGGCALTFRETSENQYVLAYVDSSGAYGLSQRRGDTFEPGLYGEELAGISGAYTLLIVANGTRLDYFINRNHVGTVSSPTVAGSMGYGVINFGPVDTACSFDRIWLWTW